MMGKRDTLACEFAAIGLIPYKRAWLRLSSKSLDVEYNEALTFVDAVDWEAGGDNGG